MFILNGCCWSFTLSCLSKTHTYSNSTQCYIWNNEKRHQILFFNNMFNTYCFQRLFSIHSSLLHGYQSFVCKRNQCEFTRKKNSSSHQVLHCWDQQSWQKHLQNCENLSYLIFTASKACFGYSGLVWSFPFHKLHLTVTLILFCTTTELIGTVREPRALCYKTAEKQRTETVLLQPFGRKLMAIQRGKSCNSVILVETSSFSHLISAMQQNSPNPVRANVI